MPRKYTRQENYQKDKGLESFRGKETKQRLEALASAWKPELVSHIWEPWVQGSVGPFLVGW